MSDAFATTPPPQPLADADTAGFWEATANGELCIARCVECGWWHQPPLERCRLCGAELTFQPVAGTGTVYSLVTIVRPSVPGYDDLVPYDVALVELDDQAGLRLPGRVDAAAGTTEIGARVRAVVVDLAGGSFRVPVFRPLPA